MNKIKVVLCGKEYSILTEESTNYAKQLADTLNNKIEQLMEDNENVSVTSAAILVALELLDDCIKIQSDKDNLRKQVIDYLEEATNGRTEIAELKRENEMLRSKLGASEKKEANRINEVAINDDEIEQTHL